MTMDIDDSNLEKPRKIPKWRK